MNDRASHDRYRYHEVAQAVDGILRAADARTGVGTRTMFLTLREAKTSEVVRRVTGPLHALGFVAVRAGIEVPDEMRQALAHRHVVLVASEDEWGSPVRDAVTPWIRELTRASCRGHLLVLVRRADRSVPYVGRHVTYAGRAFRPGAHGGPEGPPYARDEAVGAIDRLIDAADFEHAEAQLRALTAMALASGREVPPAVWRRRAALLFWQGDFAAAVHAANRARDRSAEAASWQRLTRWAAEGDALPAEAAGGLARAWLARAVSAEARLGAGDPSGALSVLGPPGEDAPASCVLASVVFSRLRAACAGTDVEALNALVESFVKRTGARGLRRWGWGRKAMAVFHGVSTLLEIVQDAADERVALRHGCSWVREHAGAEAVGIVASEGPRLIAGDGVNASDLRDPDVVSSLSGRGRAIAAGSSAFVTAPMRYAGATIGFALVRGRPDAAEVLDEAARALALVCSTPLRARLDRLIVAAASQTQIPEMLGQSPAIAALRDAVVRAAGTTFPVLIEGESGTGKELVARAVHRLSARRERRLAALNCAALTDDLAEAELFGHARGAFTGAITSRAGLFEESHGSTLFLDEVTELSPRAQAKLLRVLQEREIRRLGEYLPRPVDVRVVAATNLPLTQAVASGRFREDLLFRLAVVRIRVPALRDRIEDVPLLAQAFWRTAIMETRKHAVLGPDAVAALCRHRWPGNVRELQNVMAALAVAAPTRGRVGARHVGHLLGGGAATQDDVSEATLECARSALERRLIATALARHGGRRASAARELGLSRQGLGKAMKRLALELPVRRLVS